MNIEKIKKKKYMYCLLVTVLIIFTGCSSANKRSRLISIQQKRIKGLEKQLKNQDRIIHKLKAEKWAGAPVILGQSVAFGKLKQLVKQKSWVLALKESGRLKNIYPKSATLASYRYRIFKKMGLSQQARKEQLKLKKLRARIINKKSSRL